MEKAPWIKTAYGGIGFGMPAEKVLTKIQGVTGGTREVGGTSREFDAKLVVHSRQRNGREKDKASVVK